MASLSYDYSLQNNTVADATHVMSNFNKVKTFVEASTVQVDGSVQAGTAAIANGAVTLDKLAAAVPRGVIAKEIKTTNSANATDSVNCFTGISFTPVVGRLYRVSFGGFIGRNYSDYATIINVSFVDNTNGILQTIYQEVSSPPYTNSASLADSYLIAPATSNQITLNVRLTRSGSTDTVFFLGSSTKQNYLLVEDLGLA